MKNIINILVFLSTTVISAQTSDVLIWNSDTLNLYSNPLKLKPEWDELISLKIENERSSENKDSVMETLIFLGNYKTEWLIKNDSLYLTKITSFYDNSKINYQQWLQTEQKSIFASWVNENLIVHKGNCIICTNNHYKKTSVYPNETVLKFKNGIVINAKNYINRISKTSRFLSLNPNGYLDFIYKKIEWENIPELNDKHYQVWISVTPNKNGKLKNIDWENTFMLIDNTIITDKENPFIKEALRIVRQIPDWNIVIRHDNILNQQILIVFNAQVKDKYAH